MNVEEYLKKVAYIADSEIDGDAGKIYYSKFDKSYITRLGMEDDLKFFAEHEITDELTHGVGFSPKENKWYGWSHRAIYGFTIGSECEKGDCHYTPSKPGELIEGHARFFYNISEDRYKEKLAECQILDDRSGIRILHTPVKINVVDSVSDLDDVISGGKCPSELDEVNLFENDYSIVECGRGEWVAKTTEDAKQMAKDFCSGVS